MYSETHTSGTKQFLLAVGAAAVLAGVSSVIRRLSQAMPMIGELLSVILFAFLVYLVFVHYAATFEYKISGYTLTVTRKTGHREKIIEIKSGEITAVSKKRPDGVKTEKMCVAILLCKNPLYICYGDRAVLIDGSSELAEKLKNMMNGEKK
jgi:hypothetical protein